MVYYKLHIFNVGDSAKFIPYNAVILTKGHKFTLSASMTIKQIHKHSSKLNKLQQTTGILCTTAYLLRSLVCTLLFHTSMEELLW
jgi:hypothetical protein